MIEGKKIDLRLIASGDIQELYELENDMKEMGDFIQHRLVAKSVIEKRIAKDGYWTDDNGSMLICDKNQRIVGNIVFYRSFDYCDGYEIAYNIFRREDRGRGYMTEAVYLFCRFLFDSKPIGRLYATASIENNASRKILEKCGFQHEGSMRKAWFVKGRYDDLAFYGLLRDELQKPDESGE